MKAGILEAIEAIRPALQADGGDISLVDVDEETGVVSVELVGACGSCPASTMTLKAGIERILKDRVEGVTEVRAIGADGLASGAPTPWPTNYDASWDE
ncbi:MAG: NifU family protein [Acidimicrobiales bacterium]